MYYRLNWKNNSDEFANTDDAPDTDIPWRMGVMYDGEKPELPLICDLDPDCGEKLPDMFLVDIPLFSNRFIEVFRSCGVNNLQLFQAGVRDESGKIYDNYQAVNIIGSISCVDMENSIPIGTAQPPLMDFSKLVIDPAKVGEEDIFRIYESPLYIVITEKLKNAIDEAGLEGFSMDKVEVS